MSELLHNFPAVPPALWHLLGAVAAAYFLLLAVVALVATLHPDKERRADARRVLTVLLAVVPTRRRR